MDRDEVFRYFGRRFPFSHLHPSVIMVLGVWWSTVEQGYQCAKAYLGLNLEWWAQIRGEPEGLAQKRLSKKIQNKHEGWWYQLKKLVMLQFDFEKYTRLPFFRQSLLNAGNCPLVEANMRDRFWGRTRNEAGNIIMDIGAHLRGEPGVLPQVIILGDSILHELDQDQLARALRKNVVVKSLSGARIEYLFHAAAYVTGPYVQQIVIFGGTNDLTTKPKSKKTKAKARVGPAPLIRTLCRRENSFHQQHPNVQLVICTILNRYQVLPKITRHIQGYNAALLDADHRPCFASPTRVMAIPELPPICFQPDGLHPNTRGAQALEQVFVEQLALNCSLC